MSFRESEIDLVRRGSMQKTAGFLAEMRSAAIEALKEDLERDDLKESEDQYVLRANAIGLGMADSGAYELADSVYAGLDSLVVNHSNETGRKRHRGAILANRAILNIQLQRYDQAIPIFLQLANEIDPETYGVAPEDSYANVLREQVLDGPALTFLLDTWKSAGIAVSKPPSSRELDDLARFLGVGRLVLYAALLFLRDNIQIGLQNTNIYTALRLLDSLRIYAFQLSEIAARFVEVEHQQRGLDAPTTHGLMDCYKALFCGQVRTADWWPNLQAQIDANACADAPSRSAAQNERLGELAERKPAEWDDIVVNSLTVLHLVRNIAAHEIYPPPFIITAEANLEKVLAWLTMGGIALHREVFK